MIMKFNEILVPEDFPSVISVDEMQKRLAPQGRAGMIPSGTVAYLSDDKKYQGMYRRVDLFLIGNCWQFRKAIQLN